ncbi:MAG: hypothetical protein JJU41_10465 [Bacteroidetes bacterium]|nr:hypothetical protein [Bacteroidota bacterium]
MKSNHLVTVRFTRDEIGVKWLKPVRSILDEIWPLINVKASPIIGIVFNRIARVITACNFPLGCAIPEPFTGHFEAGKCPEYPIPGTKRQIVSLKVCLLNSDILGYYVRITWCKF